MSGLVGAPNVLGVRRRSLAGASVLSAVVAVIADQPSRAIDLVWLAVAVGAIVVWASAERRSTVVLALVVGGAVVGLGVTGGEDLEGGLFQSVVAAIAVGWRGGDGRSPLIQGAALALAPLVGNLIGASSDWEWIYWTGGVLLCWQMGHLAARLESSVREIEVARDALADAARREDRQRVAGEVHDLLGHSLTGMLLAVGGAKQALDEHPDQSREALEQAESIGRQAFDELRSLVRGLQSTIPTASDPPLPTGADLQHLCDDLARRYPWIEVETRGDLGSLDALVAVNAHRITQEATTNLLRHGAGDHGRVEVVRGPRALAIRTSNALRDAPSGRNAPGFGLAGMAERAKALDGELRAGPVDDRWELDCRIPL
ncbi:MAG: histidine kinase [Actinomycetota bacterium]